MKTTDELKKTDGYLKTEIACELFAIHKLNPTKQVEHMFKWIKKLQQADVMLSLPSDEEVEKEGEKRYGEVTGGSYHAARPMDKARFIKGAKWMREEVRKRGNGV